MTLSNDDVVQAANRVIAKLDDMSDDELIQRLEECKNGPIAYALNPYLFDEVENG